MMSPERFWLYFVLPFILHLQLSQSAEFKILSYNNVTIRKNILNDGDRYTTLLSACNNLTVQPVGNETISVKFTGVLRNSTFGCVGSILCSDVSLKSLKLSDFCNYKVNPSTVYMYSNVELGLLPPVLTTSFVINLTSPAASYSLSQEIFVTFNLSDLGQWFPNFGGYGGNFLRRSCQPGQHVQVIGLKNTSFSNTNVIDYLSLTCSDGLSYHTTQNAVNFGDLVVNCSDTFGLIGMQVFQAPSTYFPSGIRLFCGGNVSSRIANNGVGRNETYFCKSGSLITGFYGPCGLIQNGIGPICTPSNLQASMTRLVLDYSTSAIAIKSTNFVITKSVGNERALKFSFSIADLNSSKYTVMLGNSSVEQVTYGDLDSGLVKIVLLQVPLPAINVFATIVTGIGPNLITNYTIINGSSLETTSMLSTLSEVTISLDSLSIQASLTSSQTEFTTSTFNEFGSVASRTSTPTEYSTLSFSGIRSAATLASSQTSTFSEPDSFSKTSIYAGLASSLALGISLEIWIVIMASVVVAISCGGCFIVRYVSRDKGRLQKTDFYMSAGPVTSANHLVKPYGQNNALGFHSGQQGLNFTNQLQKPVSDYTFQSTETSTKTFSVTASSTANQLYVPGYLMINLQDDLILGDKVGSGGTADIYKGRFRNSRLISAHGNIDIAIKIVNEKIKEFRKEAFLYEIAVMKALPKSPYLINFIGYCEGPLSIIMKFYKTSLAEVNKILKPTPELFFKIAFDISLGMKLVHAAGIIHLDLKPHNVLIDVDNAGHFCCVICDFGFANCVGDQRTVVSGLKVPTTNGVSIRYAAPELFDKISGHFRLNSEEDKKIDIYAFGVIMYEVAIKETVWSNLSAESIYKNIKSGQRPSLEANETIKGRLDELPGVRELIKACWQLDASKRPSFEYINNSLDETRNRLALSPIRTSASNTNSDLDQNTTTLSFSQ